MAKLWLLALISILGLVSVSSYLAWDKYQQSLQDRQTMVRSAVQTASVCSHGRTSLRPPAR